MFVEEDQAKVLESKLWLYNAEARYSECTKKIKDIYTNVCVPKTAPLKDNGNNMNIVADTSKLETNKDNEEAKEDVKGLGYSDFHSDN